MVIGSAMIAFLLLGLAAPLGRRHPATAGLVHLACLPPALLLLGAAVAHLAAPPGTAPQIITLPLGLPGLAGHWRLDRLSAFFLLVVNLPAVLSGVYGLGYAPHLPRPGRVAPFLPLFLLGMNGVLLADDAFSFLLGWEFMSLTSWLLVVADDGNPEAGKAGLTYLAMAAFGGFCLLAAFALMAADGGSFDFALLRAHPGGGGGALAVLLVLLGTGSKAGMVPLHPWLPLAHPAAPSHASALMSGVMTKVALYGLIRILFDLEPALGWQWGFALMLLGAATALTGVFYALLQRDLKVLLAYSTVENVGLILVALGLAAAFRAYDQPALAALALVAALYHILNHSLIKSLLFLGAGAVISATGERDINRLGGLLNRMPVTGACFLAGACAISALPPLNGFVSEWLVFQSLFHAPSLSHWAMRFGVPVVGVDLALAAAFAAVCFVRAFGTVFLGRPRSEAAAAAREVALPLQLAQAVPVALCLGLGIFPVLVSGRLAAVVAPLLRVRLPTALLGWPWLSPIAPGAGSYSATMLLLTGVALAITTVLVVHHFGSQRTRRAPVWDCGTPCALPEAQYSADSFSQPLRRVFGQPLLAARERIDMPAPGDTAPARFRLEMTDPVWDGLYARLIRLTNALADRVNRLQSLTVRHYLLMMFWTLVAGLVIVAVRPL